MRTEPQNRPMPAPLTALIVAVLAAGAAVIAHSVVQVRSVSLDIYVVALAALTIVSGRFAIKIPGRPATVSVSEVFVFTGILLFGPAVPVLTVAVDGLWVSLAQKNRRVYRALFNVAEPAISTWIAAQVFFAIARVAPGSAISTSLPSIVPATIAMAAAFFASNSGLSALALALENGASVYEVWRGHAWPLAVNYYAAASLAALGVSTGPRINYGVAALVAPLLLLSYVAYRETSTRVDEANRHLADVERLYRAAVEMLAIAVDTKDQVTHGHIRRVQRHTLAVAAALGVTDPRELKAIEAGALLHDIGKLAVPDYVLNKPSALTTAEFETMKKHATMGARILTAVDFPYPIVPIVRHHHERWDGRGYPDGLAGAEIPLGARILAVVDCFDALTSDRPYRSRLSDEEAIAVLRSRHATFYDPVVVGKFIELLPDLQRTDQIASEPPEEQTSFVARLVRTPAHRIEAPRTIEPSTATLPLSARSLIDDHLAQLRSAEACLFTLNAAQGELVVAYTTPRLGEAIAQLRVPVGCGVSGWVAANRSAIRSAEPALDLGDIARALALQACTSLPVFKRADFFGVLTIYVAHAELSDMEIDAAGFLAQQVGVAIARDAAAPSPVLLKPPPRMSVVAVS